MKLVEFTRSEPGINKGERRLLPDEFAAQLEQAGSVTIHADPRVTVAKPAKTIVRK